MAAPRSPKQLAEIAEFVHALYEKSGAGSWAEFAARARVHAVQISDYQLGKTEPSGYNLLKMIKAAEGLPEILAKADELVDQLDALVSSLRETAAGDPDRSIEILERLGQLLRSVDTNTTTLSTMNQILDRVEQRLPAEPPVHELGHRQR